MTYSVINPDIYCAAAAGAIAGIADGGAGNPVANPGYADAESWSGQASIALAFAQEMDTRWDNIEADEFEVMAMMTICTAYWTKGGAAINATSTSPATWLKLCDAIIAQIEAMETGFPFSPGPWPGGGASGGGFPYYGDGSDGDLSVSEDTVLTRDMYYNSISWPSEGGAHIYTYGFRIYVLDTITMDNAPAGGISFAEVASMTGGAGAANAGFAPGVGGAQAILVNPSAGAAMPSVGGFGWGAAGGTGGTDIGVAGTNGQGNIVLNGGITGVGGHGGAGTVGAAGVGGLVSAAITSNLIHTYQQNPIGTSNGGTSATYVLQPIGGGLGGSGGGGGGGDNSADAGAGGGGGGIGCGVIWIAAKHVVYNGGVLHTAIVQAAAGVGGAGAAAAAANSGSGGGGSGGGGGWILFYYQDVNADLEDIFESIGGNGGAGGTGGHTNGLGGYGGSGGRITIGCLETNIYSETTGSAGGAPTLTVGGAGGLAAVGLTT